MFTLNKHDLLSFEHLLPPDALSSSTEPSVAQLIDKRIQKLTRQCFDIKTYNEQIERWFIETEKADDDDDHDDNDNNDTDNDEKKIEKEEKEKENEKEKEDKQSENKNETEPETQEKTERETQTETETETETTENNNKSIIQCYPDLGSMDEFTKYALIMFHSMISSLDLEALIPILSQDHNKTEDFGVISRYIHHLHNIFTSLTTHEIRSGLKQTLDFGVLCHIKKFVLLCISSTSANNNILYRELFEILIKLSIGNSNVSSLLECIWYLLNDYKMDIKFNLKSSMRYIANLRMLNIAENNKKYINSKVYGFGKCSDGRIGIKLHLNEQIQREPRNIDALNGVNICKLSTFSSHCLALDNIGNVYSWGSAKNLQLGYTPSTSTQIQSSPRLIPLSSTEIIIDISCGMAHSLLVSANGSVYSFGHGTNGRLGLNDENHRTCATLIKSLIEENKIIISAHCGSTFNLLIDDNGDLYSFGKNNAAQCGLNHNTESVLIPTQIATIPSSVQVTDIAAGWDHALCCCSDGSIYSWGNGYEGNRGVLGHGDKLMRLKPTMIDKLRDAFIVSVCCGYDHSLCGTQTGDVYSWGWGQYGQLGNASRKEQLFPIKISNLKHIIQIAAGENHTLCLDKTGNCFSFGHCHEYQTGHKGDDNAVIIAPKPLKLNRNSNSNNNDNAIRYIAAGDKFSLLLTANIENNEVKNDKIDNNCTSGLNELSSSFVMKLLKGNDEDMQQSIHIITYMISVIDRSCTYIVPNSEEFWCGNDKKHKENTEAFTFELSMDTFVLLNHLLQFALDKIQSNSMLFNMDGHAAWLWWLLASVLRILKAHFHVLSNKDDLVVFETQSDTALLAQIHGTILNILHGRTFNDIDMDNNENKLRILDIRRESGQVLICGLHVFHKNPNDRLTLLKSILIEENSLIEDDEILPFGRSLKEGLLQVFAQQIASQQIQSFTNNELLDDWLIVLDSVMQTIHKHINKKVLYTKKRQKCAKAKEDEEETNETEVVKYSIALCKCGDELKQMDYKKCYSGAGVNCDFCAVSIINNVWHCVKAKESTDHPNGFDLCVNCTKQPMIERQYIEDDTKDDEKEVNVVKQSISFFGDDINEECPPRHPLIAAFQSTLSSSITSAKTENLVAMKSYTNILFKHSEKVISDLYDKYVAISNEIQSDDTLNDADKESECETLRLSIDGVICVSLMGQGGLLYWSHILHVLAMYPFFTENAFNSSLNIVQLLHKMRNKPDICDTECALPFETICNLLTSLCVRLTLNQWKHYDIYTLNDASHDKKIVKLRIGDNRIKAMKKLLTLLDCDHSAQSYIILLNTSRSTISLATLFHEVHYLEGLDLDKVSHENKKELAELFGKLIQKITVLCRERGLLLSIIGAQLTNVLIPVLIDDEYELVHKYNIIELIADHIKYITHYKMCKDSSFKQKFKYREQLQTMDEKDDGIAYNIALNDESMILDKIQRGLIHALTFLVNQLCRDNASKLRFIRKQNKEKNDKEAQKRTFCKAEQLALTKLMDLLYDRIDICCDVLSSRHGIKPSVYTLIERNNALNTKKGKKSRFKSNPFLDIDIDYLIFEPVYILRKEISLGDKSPHRPYVDTTKNNLLIQGRYQLFSKANKLEINTCQEMDKNAMARSDSTQITLLNAFESPSVAYNFSISFWIKPRDTKIMRCAWGKQLIYRGKKGEMHPGIIFVGSHPSISVSFTVHENNKTNVIDLLCPLPGKTKDCFHTWWHIVVTLKNNQISIIINGDYVRHRTFTGSISAPITQFYNVGKLATKASKAQIEGDNAQKIVCQHIFDGHIRDLVHHFIPLTMSQIRNIYKRKFETKNNALDGCHLFGYKSLHLLSSLLSNHELIAPFFCTMDGYTSSNDDTCTNEERKVMSTYDSSKWFNLLFKVFKSGGFKLRREVLSLFRLILKHKGCNINLKHLAFALNKESSYHVLDEIIKSIVCSVWTKDYGLNTMIQNEVTSEALKQRMENDKDIEYAFHDKDAKTAYSPYLNTYKATTLIEADIDANISTMFGCHLLQLLWDKTENKTIIDSYITMQLKLRLEDHKKDKSAKTQKKTYAQSIATKPVQTSSTVDKDKVKSSNDKSETVKFIAVLYLLNGSILRLLPHQMAFESNRSEHLPQLTLNRGYILRLAISQNNAVFRSEIAGPQHLSLDSLIPIPYLTSCFVSESSDECFNVIIKGINTAISKSFTRFYKNDASTANQQLIVSRVTIMMMNALCRALDPMFNTSSSTRKVFNRITSNDDFNVLCNKMLSLSKNVIPSELKSDENDILPTQIKWDTPMLDMGYLEKYVQILQSYLWTNKSKESVKSGWNTKHKNKAKKKSTKKQEKDHKNKSQILYSWPSGPNKCTEAQSIQWIFKECRGKKKAQICEFCRNKPLGAAAAHNDIWKHFMIRHYGLLIEYFNFDDEFDTLRSKLDGGGDAADADTDGVSVDPRFKNLNQEYVQHLAIMGFPIEWCQFALAECNNDIAAASDWLLNHLDSIDEIMRQREEQRMQEKRKKIDDKKRKAAQFMMEYEMQFDEIKDFEKRDKNNDYLDVLTPLDIVKKANNNKIYETITNNNSYSMNDFGKTYTARPSFRRFELPHLLSRITEKYTFAQIQSLLARAQFYLATMYCRKLMALLLYHAHGEVQDNNDNKEDEVEIDVESEATPTTSPSPFDSLSSSDINPSLVLIPSSTTNIAASTGTTGNTPTVAVAVDDTCEEKEDEKEEKEEKEEKNDNDEENEEETVKKKSKNKKLKKKKSTKHIRNLDIEINKFKTIPLMAFMDHSSKKNPAHLMHLVLNLINLLTFRGDLFHDYKRAKHKINDPLHYNSVNENIRLFIGQNLIHGDKSDNIIHQRLSRHFAQHLTKFCVDDLKLLLNSAQYDSVKWGERKISFRDDQVLSNSLLYDYTKYNNAKHTTQHSKSAKKKSKKLRKKEKEKEKEKLIMMNNDKKHQKDGDYVCLERIAMIFNELFCANSVEIYTPFVYNILFDSFILSPNIYVKSMAFKFISHLEAHWDRFASDALKDSKPKRMNLKILNRLKRMFEKLYFMEKRSENDHFSVLLNSLSQFLSRIDWNKQIEDEERKEDEDDEDEIRDNIVYDLDRKWNTFRISNGISSGSAYWSIQINSSRRPSMICVGIVTKECDATSCIGSSLGSIGLLGDGSLWRYGDMISSQFMSSAQFEAGTKIGIFLNLNRGELRFVIENEESDDDIKDVIDCDLSKMTLPHSDDSNVLVSDAVIRLGREGCVWFPAVSLYSAKDAIRLINDQCIVNVNDKECILPSPRLSCNEYINVIKTMIAINNNDFLQIPKHILCEIKEWLLLWIQNKSRFLRFGAFGYDVLMESEHFTTYGVSVGDLVNFESKICRIMGEFRGRMILKNESDSILNCEHLYFVEWQYFEKFKIKMNENTKTNRFMDTKTANDIGISSFEYCIDSLSKSDLMDIMQRIRVDCNTLMKTPFDLSINDLELGKQDLNNDTFLCGFALIYYLNRNIHLLFPLFNCSSLHSCYFNDLLVSVQDLMFSHLKMSFILHLLTDSVEITNKIKSINLPSNHSNVVLKLNELSAKLNGHNPMDTHYRCVIPDRYGQLRIFNINNNDEGAGGEYRQLFANFISELQLNELLDRDRTTDYNNYNKELQDLKLGETFGRIIGFALRSLLKIPDSFWNLLWNDNNHNKNDMMCAIRRGLFFILPKQLSYLINLNSLFSIKQFSIKELVSIAPAPTITNAMDIVSLLESRAVYMEPLTRNSAHIEMFWNVLLSLNKVELFQFCKFISGHNEWPLYSTSQSNPPQINIYSNYVQFQTQKEPKKLPISSINLSQDVTYDIEYLNFLIKSYLNNNNNNRNNNNYLWICDEFNITFCNQTQQMKLKPDQYLPQVHTCTCSIRLPHYTSQDVTKDKLLKAIQYCDTFDAFNTPFPINKIVQKRNKMFKTNVAQRLQHIFN